MDTTRWVIVVEPARKGQMHPHLARYKAGCTLEHYRLQTRKPYACFVRGGVIYNKPEDLLRSHDVMVWPRSPLDVEPVIDSAPPSSTTTTDGTG